ncbi:hypothetical protein B0H19DRAFT_1133082 [Mycena capillaripes]|nr:hypothetical protein B0H19DRAFT_1133082 [Mycena capillaripes]
MAGLGSAPLAFFFHLSLTCPPRRHTLILFSSQSVNTPQQQENLNPALNNSSPVAEVLRAGLGLGAATGAPAQDPAWGDANSFTVRSLDGYRMHLWGRMAAQYMHNKEQGQGAAGAASPTSSSSTSPTSSPTAGNSPPPRARAGAHPHFAVLRRGLALLQRLPHLQQPRG